MSVVSVALFLLAVAVIWLIVTVTSNPLARLDDFERRSGKDRRGTRDDPEQCLWPQRRQFDRRES